MYAAYLFSFLLLEQFLNRNIQYKMGEQYVVFLYALCILFTALGYLSFSFIYQKRYCSIYETIVRYGFLLSLCCNVCIANLPINICLSIYATFSYGYIGAKVHYLLSMLFIGSEYKGRVLGIVTSIVLLCQSLIHNCIGDYRFLLVPIITVALCLFYQIQHTLLVPRVKQENTFTRFQTKKRYLVVLMVAVLTVMIGLQDGIITNLDALGSINVYGIPRIFYMLGVLLAGYLVDYQKGKYLGLFTIGTALLSICGILFLKEKALYSINVSLILLLGGFYVIYLTINFITLAPLTANPPLWAGMGRMIRSFLTGIIVIPSKWLFDTYGQDILIILSTIAAIILFFLYCYELSLSYEEEKAITQRNDMEAFFHQYALTPKEQEVCQLILQENKKTKEIAALLHISERSVERHLTHIFDKTAVTSRQELNQHYYQGK